MKIFTKSQFGFLVFTLCMTTVSSCGTTREIAAPESSALSRASLQTVDTSELKGNKKITVADRDAQPLVRFPPQMPRRAKTSGHCKMRFDVPPGERVAATPSNIEVLSCSKELFKRNAINNVQRWRFTSELVDGRYVGWKGVETTVWFKLKGADGNFIPE